MSVTYLWIKVMVQRMVPRDAVPSFMVRVVARAPQQPSLTPEVLLQFVVLLLGDLMTVKIACSWPIYLTDCHLNTTPRDICRSSKW
jgi:hypothetical protein